MDQQIAYVFWHWPRPEISRGSYEAKLSSFLGSLASSGVDGLVDVGSFRLDHVPWGPSGRNLYEDWYVVRDFTSLGRLNDAATTGETRPPHDSVAMDYMKGAGGVFKKVNGNIELATAKLATWIEKPIGPSYQSYYDDIARSVGSARTDLWRRQMVLGPSPQFVVHSETTLALPDSLKPVTAKLERVAV